MKTYDEAAICPKCGHGQIATRYHEADMWGCRTCAGVTAEHLRRGCERCYYSWNEAPIHPEPEKEKPDAVQDRNP